MIRTQLTRRHAISGLTALVATALLTACQSTGSEKPASGTATKVDPNAIEELKKKVRDEASSGY